MNRRIRNVLMKVNINKVLICKYCVIIFIVNLFIFKDIKCENEVDFKNECFFNLLFYELLPVNIQMMFPQFGHTSYINFYQIMKQDNYNRININKNKITIYSLLYEKSTMKIITNNEFGDFSSSYNISDSLNKYFKILDEFKELKILGIENINRIIFCNNNNFIEEEYLENSNNFFQRLLNFLFDEFDRKTLFDEKLSFKKFFYNEKSIIVLQSNYYKDKLYKNKIFMPEVFYSIHNFKYYYESNSFDLNLLNYYDKESINYNNINSYNQVLQNSLNYKSILKSKFILDKNVISKIYEYNNNIVSDSIEFEYLGNTPK